MSTCSDGSYLDTDLTCSVCDSSCNTCTGTSTRCTSCPTDPYKVKYGFSCRDSCPRFYTDENQECKLMTEALLPFILIIAWVVYVLLLLFLKVMKSHTLFFASLVSWTAFILFIWWIVLFIASFIDNDVLVGVLVLVIIAISYAINIVWCLTYFQPYIMKKDAFYFHWMKIYNKTKLMVLIISYGISFHMFRVSLCRLLSLGMFSAALHRDRVISRVMNYFSIAYICLVLCPMVGVNIYAASAVNVSDGALFYHIISWVLSLILAIMLIIEIISNNKINTYDSFLLKSTYNKIKYEVDRGKYENAINEETVLESKLNFISKQ